MEEDYRTKGLSYLSNPHTSQHRQEETQGVLMGFMGWNLFKFLEEITQW